jgi:hypothetical protein
MAKSNKRSFFVCLSALVVLLGLALLSAGASRSPKGLAPQNNSNQGKPKKDRNQLLQEIDARVPATNYDAPAPTDAEEKATRSRRNKRYDKRNMVTRSPPNGITGAVFDNHDFCALPALPVAQSNVILTAEVLNSGAHLSNDKTGVYSEFNVRVEELLKGTLPVLSQNRVITISRPGGKVRYPSGVVMNYEVMAQQMPGSGKQYVFFLEAIPDSQDYEIVTGYEIGSGVVKPLDGGQFESFRGKNVVEFINTIRDAISKN